MTAIDIHSCSYFCDRPECIKAQRDDMRDKLFAYLNYEAEYEVWQDDMPVASASGKGASEEIMHYAAQYAEDGPVEVIEVLRRRIAWQDG